MGITDFKVTFKHEGERYSFYGLLIKRDLTDGGGNPILCTKVWRDRDDHEGVVTLTPDWRIISLKME